MAKRSREDELVAAARSGNGFRLLSQLSRVLDPGAHLSEADVKRLWDAQSRRVRTQAKTDRAGRARLKKD